MNLAYLINNLTADGTLSITGGWTEDTDFPKENLFNRRMSKRGGFETAKAGEIVIDHGSAKQADIIALMNHNLTSGATVTIQANTTNSWGAPAFSEAISYRALDMHCIFAVETYRYWRIVINDSGRAGADIRIGELILGGATELDRNYDWDIKENRSYINIIHETAGGNFWTHPLYDRKSWNMKFSALSTAQLIQLKTLIDGVRGNAYPLLAVIEDAPYYVRLQDSLASARPISVPDLEFWGEDFFPLEYMIDALALTEESRGGLVLNSYTDNEDIFRDTFAVVPAVVDIVTHIAYGYRRNFAKDYYIVNDEKDDAAASAAHGREYTETIEMDWIRDPATGDDVAQRIIDSRKYASLHVLFTTAILGLQDDLADIIIVEHFAAPGALTDPVVSSIDIDLDNLTVSVIGFT